MRQIVLCLAFAVAVSACALRPRYTDFITRRTEGKSVTFLVSDMETGKPIPNARVEVSELKNRIILNTAIDGTFTLPVEKKYIDEDPVFVVTLPIGFKRYRLSALAPPAAPAENPMLPQGTPPPAIETPGTPGGPPSSAPDAGMPASNG
jgi:hypothetical protein